MANYEAYARGHGDLLADFKKNWEGKISLSQYGQMHYQNYGKKEGRSMPGGSSGGSSSYSVANQGFAGARANRAPIPTGTPGKGKGIKKTPGFMGNYSAQDTYANMAESSEGVKYYQKNVPEGQIIYQLKQDGSGYRYGFVTDDRDVYWSGSEGFARSLAGQYARTGSVNASWNPEKFGRYMGEPDPNEAKAETGGGGGSSGSGSSSSSSRPSYAPAPGGTTSSTSVNAEITATQQALNAAISAINAMASGYGTSSTAASPFPDAPASVKTYDDYVKWKRSQSAQTGYLSTVTTGSTGLSDDEMDENVVVTALTS